MAYVEEDSLDSSAEGAVVACGKRQVASRTYCNINLTHVSFYHAGDAEESRALLATEMRSQALCCVRS